MTSKIWLQLAEDVTLVNLTQNYSSSQFFSLVTKLLMQPCWLCRSFEIPLHSLHRPFLMTIHLFGQSSLMGS